MSSIIRFKHTSNVLRNVCVSVIRNQTMKYCVPTNDKNSVENIQKDVAETKSKLEEIQTILRRDNLRFYGLEAKNEGSTNSQIRKLCRDKLAINIKPWHISYSYSMTNKDGKKNIVVKFANRAIRDKIYKNKSKLRATNVVVKEDLAPSKVLLMKEVSKRMGMKHTWTYNGKIFTKRGDKTVEIKSLAEIPKLSGLEK